MFNKKFNDVSLEKWIVNNPKEIRGKIVKKVKISDNIKIVQALRKNAEGLQPLINKKKDPAIGHLNPTPRRAGFVIRMNEDAERLAKMQKIMHILADLHESGTINPLLVKIRFRTHIEVFNRQEYPEILDTYPEYFIEKIAKEQRILNTLGINKNNFLEAKSLLNSLVGADVKDQRLLKIKELELNLIGRKIPGFFPTPFHIAKKMIKYAEIEPADSILEPSAGNGAIAETILKLYPDASLSVCEINGYLRDILELKEFNIVNSNFFNHSNKYSKIIMNPPFEKFEDIDHIRHAFSLLNQGGILVSIGCESSFFRSDAKAVQFRDWLDDLGATIEKLPEGSFKGTIRSTGANARIVIIEK